MQFACNDVSEADGQIPLAPHADLAPDRSSRVELAASAVRVVLQFDNATFDK